VELVQADEMQKNIVQTLHDRLGFDFVGVDFLPDGAGGWVVNEIEDCAGARMLYQTSDVDITALMIERIKTGQV
jgi:glutathione synthase/RimK-type ligase-like ATP-grasp enzyme